MDGWRKTCAPATVSIFSWISLFAGSNWIAWIAVTCAWANSAEGQMGNPIRFLKLSLSDVGSGALLQHREELRNLPLIYPNVLGGRGTGAGRGNALGNIFAFTRF